MLWYKSWLDTRWRFLVGLGLLSCAAAGIVLAHRQVMGLLPFVPTVDATTELGRRVKEAAELIRNYRGYIWAQWFNQTPVTLGTVFAVLLGSGGFLSHGTGGTLFTLSLPASRQRLLWTRALTGLAELAALAFIPSLIIPLMSPAIGESYGVVSALMHGACLFAGMAVFFSFAMLLSTMLNDIWPPLLIALGVAFVIGLCEGMFPDVARYGIYNVMHGETYFRNNQPPWLGLATLSLMSAGLLFGAELQFRRRDF